MSGRGSRLKGANGEREFFDLSNELIEEKLFARHPNPWHGRGKKDNHDPDNKLPVAVEVKRCETLALSKWIEQAKAQAAATQVPILAYRKNQQDWTILAIMDDNEWKRYLRWKLKESNHD